MSSYYMALSAILLIAREFPMAQPGLITVEPVTRTHEMTAHKTARVHGEALALLMPLADATRTALVHGLALLQWTIAEPAIQILRLTVPMLSAYTSSRRQALVK
jgi:hypothetical protein